MKTSLSISLLAVIITFSACKQDVPEPEKPLAIFYLTDEDRTHFPFFITHGDLSYITSEGIVEYQYGQHFDAILQQSIPNSQSYYEYEMEMKTFLNERYILAYDILAGSEEPEQLTNMTIAWYESEFTPKLQPPCTIDFDLPFESNLADTTYVMHDSLFVNEVWYTNILSGPVIFFPDEGNAFSEVIPTKFYYSSSFGIVRFDMSDSTTWDLISPKY